MDGVICSIVIPTYNGSASVKHAVESAIRQKRINVEIIVVDDNGKDTEEQKKTERILRDYIDQKEIVYLCHNFNKNGSAARNTGLYHSHGDFVAFLDDDDYIKPTKCYKQIKKLQNNLKCAMCVCSGCYVNKAGIGYRKILHKEKEFMLKYLLDKIYFNTSAIVFRREALLEIGGFDESFKRHQDWELVTRVLSKYAACVIEDVEMIRYLEGRNNPKSFEQRIENLEHFFCVCEPYMRRKLTEKQINVVKKFRRREICQSMIRSGAFWKAVKYGKSYGGLLEIVKAFALLFPLFIRKILIGNSKVAPKRDY